MIKTDINGQVHCKYPVLNIVTTSGLLNSILPLRVDLGASWDLLKMTDWSWNTTDLDGPRSLLTAMNCEIHLSHLTSPMRNLLQGMLKIIWQSLQSWQEIVKAHFPPTKPVSTKDVKHVTAESLRVFFGSERSTSFVAPASGTWRKDTDARHRQSTGLRLRPPAPEKYRPGQWQASNSWMPEAAEARLNVCQNNSPQRVYQSPAKLPKKMFV